jgi:hypothetical protein
MPDLPTRRRPPGLDWMRPITERLTPSVKTIIIAQACIYFFYVFVRQARDLMVKHLTSVPDCSRARSGSR